MLPALLMRGSRTILLLAFVLASGLAFLTAGCRRPAPREQDNVVLVVIDTLRQDHLATYGYGRDTAPFLSALARQGVVFDGLSPTSWTKPATASLLTGLHPLRHQAFARRDRLPDGVTTLAERLHAMGYRTLGASANGWVCPSFGFDRGFDTFTLDDNARADELVGSLVARLESLPKPLGRPFFLYVHMIDPHLPYDPSMAWDGNPLPAGLRGHPVTVEEADATHFRPRSPEFLARARDLYDGEIRETDQALATLVRWLDRHGLMRNTVLVATADHGEEMAEHGRMSHGQTLYEELLHVPLIFHAPHRFPAGRRFGAASLMDVVPTLVELLGEPAGDLDGVSLAGLLTGRPGAVLPDRPFLFHLDFRDGASLAMLHGRRKLVLSEQPYRKELFDLDRDPGEQHSLLGEGEADVRRLGKEMAGIYNKYNRRSAERIIVPLADDAMQRLSALGYVAPVAAPSVRRIPLRIEPPDPFPDGRLGWEKSASPETCVKLAAPDNGHSLLAGWTDDPEQGGRWTVPPAGTLALPWPDAWVRPTNIVLVGANYRPAPVRLRVSVERRPVLDTEVAPGSFELRAALAGPSVPRPMLVTVSTDTPFVPAASGKSEDTRALGIFLTAVCAESQSGS